MGQRGGDRGVVEVDLTALGEALRHGGPPSIDDVSVMADGRRIRSAADVRRVVAEFDEHLAAQARRERAEPARR